MQFTHQVSFKCVTTLWRIMRLLCERIAKALRSQCDCNAHAMRLHAEKKRKEPKEKKRDEEEYYIYK